MNHWSDLCCCRAFDNLRDVRGLEYELDFVTNRANRDLQVHLLYTNFACLSCTGKGISQFKHCSLLQECSTFALE